MGASAKAADSPAKGSDESLSVCCRLNLDDDDYGGHKADITATQRKRNHQQILKASRFFFPSNSPIPEASPSLPVSKKARTERKSIRGTEAKKGGKQSPSPERSRSRSRTRQRERRRNSLPSRFGPSERESVSRRSEHTHCMTTMRRISDLGVSPCRFRGLAEVHVTKSFCSNIFI